jgi:hypothetical protein
MPAACYDEKNGNRNNNEYCNETLGAARVALETVRQTDGHKQKNKENDDSGHELSTTIAMNQATIRRTASQIMSYPSLF